MGLVFRTIEPLLGWLLSNHKNHDAGLFTNSPAVSTPLPTPNMTVSSPSIGASGSPLPVRYASPELGGSGAIVPLTWEAPARAAVAEYVLVIEDPDAPMAEPVVHGLYYGIPGGRTVVGAGDFEVVDVGARTLRGGFFYGVNRAGSVYVPPRPVRNHGPDRYVFSVVALGAELGVEGGVEGVGKAQVLRALEGKVVGWRQWVGTYENKW